MGKKYQVPGSSLRVLVDLVVKKSSIFGQKKQVF